MKLKPGKKMPLGIKQAETLVNMINLSCDDELDCNEVFKNLDIYAEFVLNPGDKTRIIRMIEDHLKICMDCAEEFQLLLKALKA
ncbi:MAG: hypothetical protein KAH21_03260 [Spirochaetaceae bacterium]|nr:hypothetical protein [Spirochaetaceae bacterium]